MVVQMQIRRTATPNAAPPNGSLAPGQLAIEMASPAPRLWVGTDPTLAYAGNRRLVIDSGGFLPLTGGALSGPGNLSIGGNFSGVTSAGVNYLTLYTPGVGVDLMIRADSGRDAVLGLQGTGNWLVSNRGPDGWLAIYDQISVSNRIAISPPGADGVTPDALIVLTGRTQLYNPGATRPLEILTDTGSTAVIQYSVNNVPTWYVGSFPPGVFRIQTAAGPGIQIDGLGNFLSGAATIAGDLQVTGPDTAVRNLLVDGVLTVNSNITALGLSLSGGLDVTGGVTIAGVMAVGATTVGGDLDVTGPDTAVRNLLVDGVLTVNSNISGLGLSLSGGLAVAGNATMAGTLTADGNITGDAFYTRTGTVGFYRNGVTGFPEFNAHLSCPSGLTVNTGLTMNESITPGADNAYWCGYAGAAWFGVGAYNLGTQSDRRLKKDFLDVPEALPKIMQIPAKRFRWRTGPDDRHHWGLIADDVREVMGEEFGGWMRHAESGIQNLFLNDLIAVLWRGVQELCEALEKRGRQ